MATPRTWSNACANVAAWICAQAKRNAFLWGPPGVSKSASAYQMAKSQGKEFLLLLGSTMAPEDVGGIPHVMTAEQFFRSLPPWWADRLSRPGVVLMADEFTCTAPSVRAPLQTMYSDRRIGQLEIHEDNWLIAAANPVQFAPNASPIEKAMSNRFVHFDFVHNYEAWRKGMESDKDQFGEVFVPTLPTDWRRFIPKWGSLIVGYLDKNSTDRIAIPDNDDDMAYPTPRTWHILRDCLAAAEAVEAPGHIEARLAHGCIGKVAGANFLKYRASLDLVDPEEVLADPSKFKFDRHRVDLTSALMSSIVSAVKLNYSEDRLTVATELFCNRIGKHAADLVFTQLRYLLNCRPEGTAIPAKTLKIVSDFGKTIPASVKPKGGK